MRSPTRRTVLVAVAAGLLPGCGAPEVEHAVADGNEALDRLTAGNERFASGNATDLHEGDKRRTGVAAGQQPFATILSCVDSRVPPEMVFDRGLGDLVVVRSAGGVVDRSVLGSVEFGVAELKTPLVLVLGHQRCGAVQAAVSSAGAEGSIGFLVSAIRPAVDRVRRQAGDVVDNAVRANVGLIRDRLRRSPVLSHHKALVIVGGYYSLDTGRVKILE